MLDGLALGAGADDPRHHRCRRASRSACPTFAFTWRARTRGASARACDQAGICAWDGNYYALEVTTRLGLEAGGGMVRVGAVHYTTVDEIAKLVDALGALRKERT